MWATLKTRAAFPSLRRAGIQGIGRVNDENAPNLAGSTPTEPPGGYLRNRSRPDFGSGGSLLRKIQQLLLEVLYQISLTPRKLKPQEFRELTKFGLGLTDLAKTASGVDSDLQDEAFDVIAFIESIDHCRPALVAFNGKMAARIFYGMPARAPLNYGEGAIVPNFPRVFVLPSTSGSARGHWDLEWWREFARLVVAG
jgi:TDG/mug DNA glycosylase family protein